MYGRCKPVSGDKSYFNQDFMPNKIVKDYDDQQVLPGATWPSGKRECLFAAVPCVYYLFTSTYITKAETWFIGVNTPF